MRYLFFCRAVILAHSWKSVQSFYLRVRTHMLRLQKYMQSVCYCFVSFLKKQREKPSLTMSMKFEFKKPACCYEKRNEKSVKKWIEKKMIILFTILWACHTILGSLQLYSFLDAKLTLTHQKLDEKCCNQFFSIFIELVINQLGQHVPWVIIGKYRVVFQSWQRHKENKF